MRHIIKTGIVILCVLLASGSAYAQNNGQGERKRKDAKTRQNNVGVIRQSIVVDKDLLDVYARMMRYQTAWQDMVNWMYGYETMPDDYLTIAVRNVEEGDLKNLSNYLKMIKQPSKEILAIHRQTRCDGTARDECELAYDVSWSTEKASKLKFNMPNTGNVDKYIMYDITVEYQGKSVTHGGVAVHYRNKNAGFMIYDGIIPQIDDLILDKQPLMVEQRRMSRIFTDPQREKVKELPPAKVWSITPEEENPIGWLPDDDVEWGDVPIMMMMAGDPCQYARDTSRIRLGKLECYGIVGNGSGWLHQIWADFDSVDIVYVDFGLPGDTSSLKFGEAGFNNGRREIRLNSSVNWNDLTKQTYVLANGTHVQVNVLNELRAAVQDPTMTNGEAMQLVILHEFGHFYGLTHDNSNAGNNQYNKAIWDECGWY